MKPKKKQIGGFFISLFLIASLIFPVTVFAEPENSSAGQTNSSGTSDPDKPDSYFEAIQTNEIPDWPQGPAVYAQSAVVMEADTGAILYAKNMDQQLYPASITKIMTSLVALENSRLTERVTFSKDAIFGIERDSSHIGIRVGEILSMEDCLYGMMLASANEVCLAVAEHIGGSVEGFVNMMNQKAAELGCKNTHFTNPNGLPDENHYTTAYDMALIAQAAYAREDFREINKTRLHAIETTNLCGEKRWLSNHHKMMQEKAYPEYFYTGITGGKTGYTQVALNTLVTYANRNDTDLICVTMKTNGRQVYLDTASLLDYGFENFHKETLTSGKTAPVTELFADSSVILGQPWLSAASSEDYLVLPNNWAVPDLGDTALFEEPFLTETLTVQGHQLARTRSDLSRLTTKLLTEAPVYEFLNAPNGSESKVLNTKKTDSSSSLTFADLPAWKYAALGILILAIILYIIMLTIRIRRRRRRRKRLQQLRKRY